MKVTACLNGRPDKEGKKAVCIRTADGLKRTYESTNIKVLPKNFSAGKVKGIPQAKAFNDVIARLVAERFINKLEGETYNDFEFFAYCTLCLNQWDKIKKWSTIVQHKAELSKLKQFVSKIYLSEITPSWLDKYRGYCYSLGNKENTVWKTFKFIKVIIRKAHRERIIKENPFDIFAFPKYTDPEKNFLTEKEIKKIEKFNGTIAQNFLATWFLICCRTGLRYSDAAAFDKKKIRGGRLILYTQKTGTPVSIPFTPELKELFETINYRHLDITNEHANRMLKEIGKKAGLKERLTYHTSRHSFAVRCASAGITKDATAVFLGHTSTKTTSIYYKLTNPVLDSEYEKLS